MGTMNISIKAVVVILILVILAVSEADLAIESVNKVDDKTWMIMAKKSTSAWSWGEIVRVTVINLNTNQTEVKVYTEKRSSINVTAKGDYSTPILTNIELKLKS